MKDFNAEDYTYKCEKCGEEHCVVSFNDKILKYEYDCPDCGNHSIVTPINLLSSKGLLKLKKKNIDITSKSCCGTLIVGEGFTKSENTSISLSINENAVKEIIEKTLKERGL